MKILYKLLFNLNEILEVNAKEKWKIFHHFKHLLNIDLMKSFSCFSLTFHRHFDTVKKDSCGCGTRVI
jgi:hypothetical protein